ncbi:MAG: UDP-N-acetylglucosamine 2-epimerase (non-hydrolyzing) [Thermoplasmata archaeon]
MISLVVGTRPEIIKMGPIVLELKRRQMDFDIIHTAQHYDRELSGVFFNDLGLPDPDRTLDVGSGSQAVQTGEALVKLERTFGETEPDVVLVEGDTNSVLAGALAAAKMGIDVGHVEAGLRSHDLRMPEEHNRKLTDHLSSFLFAPTTAAEENLKKENVWGRIWVTGNTVIEACMTFMEVAAEKSDILDKIGFERFCLATAHRKENVDDRDVLSEFVETFLGSPVPVVYPIHPRTVKMLKEFGLYDGLSRSENVQLLPPVGYLDFLLLMRGCEFILTDSGGIQEEATSPNIRKKVFVLRTSTERPEAVEAGYCEVVGTDSKRALAAINAYTEKGESPTSPSPYGDGTASARIVDALGNS